MERFRCWDGGKSYGTSTLCAHLRRSQFSPYGISGTIPRKRNPHACGVPHPHTTQMQAYGEYTHKEQMRKSIYKKSPLLARGSR